MVESNKKVKVCYVLCFGCFLAKGCCWTRLFQFTWFLLSTGTSQLPQEWRSTKVMWFASSLTSPSQTRVQSAAATRSSDVQCNDRKDRVPFPQGDWALCLWHTPSFPDELSWMPYNINANTKPIDSIPSGTEPCARPPTVALIVQSAEEWDHYVEFWGMASRWEQSDKAGNHHRGGKKSN